MANTTLQSTNLCLMAAAWLPVARSIPVNNSLVFSAPETVLRTETVCKTSEAADFILVIDGSTSIGADNFDLLRNWLADTAEQLPESTRYAVIEFSGRPVTLWNLAAYNNTSAVVKAFRNMRYIMGTTKLALALEYVIEEGFLLKDNGNRKKVPDNIVVITDGRSSDDPHAVAKRLREEFGVNLFAVGITNAIDSEQLNDIVTGVKNPPDGDYFLKVQDFKLLDAAITRQLIESREECTTREFNETIGEGTIDLQCNPDSISVRSPTLNAFEGKVYVRGNVNDADCVSRGDGLAKMAEMTVGLDQCGTTKRRSLNPPGIFVENEVVFSFHSKFITKVDRVFKVQCFFMEAQKTVNAGITVGSSKQSTEFAADTFPMPACSYTLHRESHEGPQIRFAVIGEKVFHRWHCDDTESGDLLRLKVHTCYVENQYGRQDLIDANGCATDPTLLPDLVYEEGQLLAHVGAHAFKFPDEADERFQCEVELCVNLEDNCENVPPNCEQIRSKRDVTSLNGTASATRLGRRSLDVRTETLTVVTADEVNLAESQIDNLWSDHSRRNGFCMSMLQWILAYGFLFLITLIATVCYLSVLLKSNNRYAHIKRKA